MKKAMRISESVTEEIQEASIAREESDVVSKSLLRVTARIQKPQEIPGSTKGKILIAG